MTYVSKTELIGGGLPTEDVDLPGIGEVRIRSLSMAEATMLAKLSGDELKLAQHILRSGFVEPKLTMNDVKTLMESRRPGDLQEAVNSIMRLSGLDAEVSDKDVFRGDGEES